MTNPPNSNLPQSWSGRCEKCGHMVDTPQHEFGCEGETMPPRPPTERGRTFVARLRAVARECGYAVGVHGSQARDLDLIAVPWAAEAVSADALVARICEELNLHEQPANVYPDNTVMPNPEPKPWGRLAWSLVGCPRPWKYVDLSVAPRAGEAVPLIHWRDRDAA